MSSKGHSEIDWFLKHIRAVHEKQKPYKCESCDSSFAQGAHLRAHVTAIHLGIKPYKCEICDANFGSYNAHEYHVRSVHNKIKPFSCEHCGEKYSGKQNLKHHIARKHEGFKVDTVQDFLNKLGIKPRLHILKISIFSLNHGMNFLKVCKICTFKVTFWHQKPIESFWFFSVKII